MVFFSSDSIKLENKIFLPNFRKFTRPLLCAAIPKTPILSRLLNGKPRVAHFFQLYSTYLVS